MAPSCLLVRAVVATAAPPPPPPPSRCRPWRRRLSSRLRRRASWVERLSPPFPVSGARSKRSLTLSSLSSSSAPRPTPPPPTPHGTFVVSASPSASPSSQTQTGHSSSFLQTLAVGQQRQKDWMGFFVYLCFESSIACQCVELKQLDGKYCKFISLLLFALLWYLYHQVLPPRRYGRECLCCCATGRYARAGGKRRRTCLWSSLPFFS